jgi:mannose-1-phosphate guanylyltransferase/phosphomannomutase
VYDVEIKYAHEEKPLGSAGGVKNAAKYTSGDLLVISGDAVFEGELSDMIKRHYNSSADLTVACTEMEDTSRFGVLVTDKNGRITSFCEKPKKGECDSRLVNIGIYIISREIIDSLPENTPLDFSLDVFPNILENKRMMAWKSDAYWCDMGTLSSYLECNMRYSKGKNIIGKNCNISPDAKISGSIIFDGVTVEANACICDAVICKDAHIGNGAGVARGSVIGESCSVSASEVVSPDSMNITRVTSQEIMRNDIPNALTMSID